MVSGGNGGNRGVGARGREGRSDGSISREPSEHFGVANSVRMRTHPHEKRDGTRFRSAVLARTRPRLPDTRYPHARGCPFAHPVFLAGVWCYVRAAHPTFTPHGFVHHRLPRNGVRPFPGAAGARTRLRWRHYLPPVGPRHHQPRPPLRATSPRAAARNPATPTAPMPMTPRAAPTTARAPAPRVAPPAKGLRLPARTRSRPLGRLPPHGEHAIARAGTTGAARALPPSGPPRAAQPYAGPHLSRSVFVAHVEAGAARTGGLGSEEVLEGDSE